MGRVNNVDGYFIISGIAVNDVLNNIFNAEKSWSLDGSQVYTEFWPKFRRDFMPIFT